MYTHGTAFTQAVKAVMEQKQQKEQPASDLGNALLTKAKQLMTKHTSSWSFVAKANQKAKQLMAKHTPSWSFVAKANKKAKQTAARRQLDEGGGGDKVALAKATRLLLGSAGSLSSHLVEGGKRSARTSGVTSVAKRTQVTDAPVAAPSRRRKSPWEDSETSPRPCRSF